MRSDDADRGPVPEERREASVRATGRDGEQAKPPEEDEPDTFDEAKFWASRRASALGGALGDIGADPGYPEDLSQDA